MFKNRRIQVSFVKNNETPDTDPTTDNSKVEHYTALVYVHAKQLVTYVGIGVAGYIVLDTARQCAIKATPQH